MLVKAFKEARRLRQNWLGPEHYLLAVLAEQGVATDAMAELGVTHDRIAGQLTRMNTVNGRRIRYLESKGITANPRSHDVSGWANGFAAASGRLKPSREEWLLAALYEGGGIVWTVLHELGTSTASAVEVMRRQGVRTPDFDPEEESPWRGHREIEVAKSEWQGGRDSKQEAPARLEVAVGVQLKAGPARQGPVRG